MNRCAHDSPQCGDIRGISIPTPVSHADWPSTNIRLASLLL